MSNNEMREYVISTTNPYRSIIVIKAISAQDAITIYRNTQKWGGDLKWINIQWIQYKELITDEHDLREIENFEKNYVKQ